MHRLCVLFIVLGLTPAARSGTSAFHFNPPEPLLDEVVQIRLTGLAPGSTIVVRATASFAGRTWKSFATFVADRRGTIDVAGQAPQRGTYSGRDAMGLFWSMEPEKGEPQKDKPLGLRDPRSTRFEAESDGKIHARAELKRWLIKGNVRITDVKENGLVGKLFEPEGKPEGKDRRPGLLVLSGSDGGIPESEAALLAAHGYVTFALAYFRAEGLPKELVRIPLEYLRKGVDWLAPRPSVDPKRVGVVGGSKGGELALLLASRCPELKVVVARAPSHVAWSGIGGSYSESGWTEQGKPVPFLRTKPGPAFFAQLSAKDPLRLVELYRPALDNKESEAKALIPVEKINGAVLLISGKDDQMWPAALMADKVMARLREAKHPHPFEHLCYADAGHGIPSAYIPTRLTLQIDRLALGGTPEANARALADSRAKLLRFLDKNLGARR